MKIEVYKCDCCRQQFDWDMSAADPPDGFLAQTVTSGESRPLDINFEHVCPACLHALSEVVSIAVDECRNPFVEALTEGEDEPDPTICVDCGNITRPGTTRCEPCYVKFGLMGKAAKEVPA